MTTLQYITSPVYGCCTTGELMQAAKNNPEFLTDMKKYATEEMINRGIEITATSK
jgi:hypothetical protein